jgi:phage terminase large subunit-like protein
MGMRENPHLMILTTAGYNLNSVCYQLRNDCVDVLNNVSKNDNIFAAIFELDENDDYTDEKVWQKANPNLDITVRKDWLRDQVKACESFRYEEANVLTKNMNMWINGASTWIEDKYVLQCFNEIPDFDKSEVLTYVGVDLSSVSDLTSVNYLIVKDNVYYFDTHYYLPEQFKTDNNYNALKFKEWANSGFLKLTQGNVTDYDYILNDILNYKYQIKAVFYDTYNATQFSIQASQNGLDMIAYSQSVASFNKATKEIERLIKQNHVVMNNNPLTIFCYRNVVLKIDHANNCKPDKSDRENKIDGVIAQLMSLSGYLLTPVAPSIF